MSGVALAKGEREPRKGGIFIHLTGSGLCESSSSSGARESRREDRLVT